LDKIANEIPFILLEHNAFSSILNFIDFFDLNIRKYAVRICQTLTKHVKNNIIFKKNIQAGLSNLTNLTKFCGISDLEKYILDASINCFYCLLRNIKNYKIYENNKNIYSELTENGLIINLLETLVNLVYLLNTNYVNNNSKQYENYGEIIKKIFIILENLTVKSDTFSNDFLEIECLNNNDNNNNSNNYSINLRNISIFAVINIIIDTEIGRNGKNYNINENDNDNDRSNFRVNNNESDNQYKSGCFQNIMNNVFNFLISLYPQDTLEVMKEDMKEDMKDIKEKDIINLNNFNNFEKINNNTNNIPGNNNEIKSQRIINKFCNENFNLFYWNYIYNENSTNNYKDISNKDEDKACDIPIIYNNNDINNDINNNNSNNNINNNNNNNKKIKNTRILLNQIIPKLLTNFINFSSSSNSSYKLLKFLKIFISNSTKELIQRIINPKLISNILSSKLN
jgi:hypothetical protein